MAWFSSEAAVREKFQVADTAVVSLGLVERSLTDAHAAIARRLSLDADTQTPAEGLVLGETLLAGAYVLRSLASKSAAAVPRDVRIGGNQVVTGERFALLMPAAEAAEREAWEALEPFLKPLDGVACAVVSDTLPVLGG